MAHFQTTLAVPTSPADTFDYLARFDTTEEWDPGVTEATMVTEEPVALGSRFALQASFLGRTVPLEYEIVEFDPPRRVVLRAENRAVTSVDTITVEADGSGSALTYDAQLRPRGVMRLFAPLLDRMFRRIGEQAAAGLGTALRNRIPEGTP